MSDLPVYKLPHVVETRLENGLTVLLVEDHSSSILLGW